MQMLADLTGCQLDRSPHRDMTSLGAAFLAGLAVGEHKFLFLMKKFCISFC
jgi:glycerol kinase